MTHREKRCKFTECLAKLILWAISQGYEVAIDEATEHLTKKDPTSDHGAASWHHKGLACDLNLYRDGRWLSITEDHAPLGHYWESLDPACSWGGRWQDGNHYSWGEGK